MLAATWQTLCDLAPWLLLGAAIAGVLHVLVPESWLRRHLSGKHAVLKAAAVGVPMPLCSCSVIPVALGLRRAGASRGATVAFLSSTPQTGVDSILVSGAMLGVPFALFKLASALVIGVLAGWLTNRVAPQEEMAGGPPPESSTSENSPTSAWRRGYDHALMILHSIWRWLVVGVLISAAITSWAPRLQLERAGAYGEAAAMLAALAIGAPLYVCATASVPIAAALVAAGFPAGAALVFLVAGPATNVATMGAVYRTLGGRSLAAYLSTIAVGSLACGALFNRLVATGPVVDAVHHHESASPVAVAAAVVLIGLLLWFMAEDWRAWREAKRTRPVVQLPIVTIDLPKR